MHFRLVNLDLIFAFGVSSRRDPSPDQHPFSAGKIAAHVRGQVEPHEPNPPTAYVEPPARELPPTRATHRPLYDLAEVALDDCIDSGPQIFDWRAFAPI